MEERVPLEPGDLMRAAGACRAALEPCLEADWEVAAGDLEWSCRRTLDHVADALLFYAVHLAARAGERLPVVRDGDPERTPAELLGVVDGAAAILAAVARAAPASARGFHPAGMADPEGFVAMGCEEILVHASDVASGLGVAFDPPRDLCERVCRRIFPWAPRDGDPWSALLWAAGRIALPDRARLDEDWYWHCAPLAEWDGTVKRRQAPPAWR